MQPNLAHHANHNSKHDTSAITLIHIKEVCVEGCGGRTIKAPVAGAGVATIGVDATSVRRAAGCASGALIDVNVASGTLKPGQAHKKESQHQTTPQLCWCDKHGF